LIAANPSVSPVTGWPVGFWWAEVTHPYWAFVEAGYEVEIRSPAGGALVADGYSDPEDASLRPALVTSRLEVLADGSVRLALKRAWSDGTTSRTFTALEVVERLASLVPPPAANQVVYGGVLAPRHRWHRLVRPAPRRVAVPRVATVRLTRRPRGSSRHVGWAELLWSTFGVFGAACPTCGAR
jgi:putative intracellular protease/amidase